MVGGSVVEGLEKKRMMEEEWNSIFVSKQLLSRHYFPPNFTFGVATSAFQVLFLAKHFIALMARVAHCHLPFFRFA